MEVMKDYIVTIRLPRNTMHPRAFECDRKNRHIKVEGGHCAYMGCPNYKESCPAHAIAKTGDTCNREKQTGMCPVSGAEFCTDVTGEHHSYLITSESLDDVRSQAEDRLPDGAHVTRIESV